MRATNELLVRSSTQDDKLSTNASDKAVIAAMGSTKPLTCPPNSDTFSPTIDSTGNEDRELGSSVVISTTANAEAITIHGGQRTSITTTKRVYAINRSDSVGSLTGRKYIAPTSSDPQRSTLTEGERWHVNCQQKKKNSMTITAIPSAIPLANNSLQKRAEANKNTSFAQINYDGNQFHFPLSSSNHHDGFVANLSNASGSKFLTFTNHASAVYEVHDWWQNQISDMQFNGYDI